MDEPKEQFLRLAADALSVERFTLVDIGCSGGLDPSGVCSATASPL
jgi:hypothetical protein